MKFVRTGLTTGLLPRRTVLCWWSFGPNPNITPINPAFFHYSLRVSCKRKEGDTETFYFSEISGFWPSLIDRSHDAPA